MTAKAPEISKDELVELYSIASTVTRDLPGNIPGFLKAAYEAQFKARFPKKIAAVETDMSKSDLVATLEALKGFNPEAQASIDRACTVLTDGAALSMNIELKEGQGLPVALHTLLQGTVWAILMCGIADPDFTPSKLRHRAPARKRDQYTAKARHLWFMCKKFYFAHQMSEKDGWQSAKWPCSRLYSGRLFVKEGHVQLPEYAHSYFKYTRVRVPAVLAVEMSAKPMDWPVLVTSKGLYLWSIAHNEDEGRNEDLAPRLMEFRHCNSAVASFYDSLPVWHKNRIVVDLQVRKHALLCTPVGACFTLPGEPFFLTAHDMPPSFIPTKARMTRYVDVFSSETTHMITGYNERGELGFGQQLGYRQDPVRHYKKFPLPFEGFAGDSQGQGFNVFVLGGRVCYAGVVPQYRELGELHTVFRHFLHLECNDGLHRMEDGEIVMPLTELTFPETVKRFWCTSIAVYCVYEGRTEVTLDNNCSVPPAPDTVTYSLPFEATGVTAAARGEEDGDRFFRDSEAVWWCVKEEWNVDMPTFGEPMAMDDSSMDELLFVLRADEIVPVNHVV